MAFRSHLLEHMKQRGDLPRKGWWADNQTSALNSPPLPRIYNSPVLSSTHSLSPLFYIIQFISLCPSLIRYNSVVMHFMRMETWSLISQVRHLQTISAMQRLLERALNGVAARLQRGAPFTSFYETLTNFWPSCAHSQADELLFSGNQLNTKYQSKCKLLSPFPEIHPVVKWLSDECISYCTLNYLLFWKHFLPK